jgi:hypothetical protein
LAQLNKAVGDYIGQEIIVFSGFSVEWSAFWDVKAPTRANIPKYGVSQTQVYWVIEAEIKLEPRQAILAAFADIPVHVKWVLTANLLREESRKPGSLRYPDAESGGLTTYLGLKVIQLPQRYQGQ